MAVIKLIRKPHYPTVISFVSIPACDRRQTDGQTRRLSLCRAVALLSTTKVFNRAYSEDECLVSPCASHSLAT